MFEIFYYYLQFSGIGVTSFFFGLLAIYFVGYSSYHILNLIIFHKPLPDNFKTLIKRAVIACIIISIFFTLLAVTFERLIFYTQQPSKVAFFSSIFLQIDKAVFGTYVPFWFQSASNPLKPVFDFLSFSIIMAYESLAFLLGILFFTLFMVKPSYFYKACLSFALMLIISLPLWFFFPAVSPFDAYVDNIMHIPTPQYLQATLLNYHPNKNLVSFFNKLSNINKGNGSILVTTTMPSMHLAWAVLIFYFGIKLYKPLVVFLIPYFLLNAIATVYLLQHYAVDLLVGLMVAIISIWLANLIAKKKPLHMFADNITQ